MFKPKIIKNEDLDFYDLDRKLDKIKTSVFLGKNAAFLGSLMCRLSFSWTSDIKTACTNGISLWWNPYWFLKLPVETQKTVLMHELWHVGEMDMLRRDGRDPLVWNWACDIRINNRLEKQGYSFEGTKPWKDLMTFHCGPVKFGDQAPEQIYDKLIDIRANEPEMPQMQLGAWGQGDDEDLIEPEEDNQDGGMVVLTNVTSAVQAADMAGEKVGGDIETMLKRFLQPKIAWEKQLFRWYDALHEEDYSMSRPNKRYREVYLPSLIPSEGLEHLMYFLDVSGSVGDGEVIRFNSELKYIWDVMKPEKLTIVLFDDIIQKVIVFESGDSFDEIVIIGRGGTSLEPVRLYIEEHKPTAAVIFSDLYCEPMRSDPKIPLLWVCVNNPSVKPPFGDCIYIRE